MQPNFKNVAAIVLAAGESTRFYGGESAPFQKVLLTVAGKPIISRVVELLEKLVLGQIIIVIGYKARDMKQHLGGKYTYAVQNERKGTGHALKCGLEQVREDLDTVLVLNGDDSFRYKPQTIAQVLKRHQGLRATLTFVTLEREDVSGLGRILRDQQGKVLRVIEEKDATVEQRLINEVNDGVYVFEKDWLSQNIKNVEPSPVTGEYYVVDLIGLAVSKGKNVQTYKLPNPAEWFGVNTPQELALANQ